MSTKFFTASPRTPKWPDLYYAGRLGDIAESRLPVFVISAIKWHFYVHCKLLASGDVLLLM